MEQAKDYASTIARRIGFAAAALAMAVTVFAVAGWPPAHWWLMVLSIGFLAHSVAYAAIFTVNGRPYVPVVWANDPEPQPVESPGGKQEILSHAAPAKPEQEPGIPDPLFMVLSMVEDKFITSTNWGGLALHLKTEPEPAFTRSGLSNYVEQRFYSKPPGQIYTTFPELMMRLKLARPDGDSFQWRDPHHAGETLALLANQVRDFYPTPPAPVIKSNRNRGYNRSYGSNQTVTGGRGVNEVEHE